MKIQTIGRGGKMKNLYKVVFKKSSWAGVDVVAESEEEAKKIA